MVDKFVLDNDGAVVPCADLETWARWFEHANRVVGNDHVGPARVSTIFLGLDHSFGHGRPLLFETMVFWPGHALNEEQDRYTTLEEARAGHARVVALVKAEQCA
jgi:hypothetical protein